MQGQAGALGGADPSYPRRQGGRQYNGRTRRDGRDRVAEQRDYERLHQMSGREDRDIGRKIIGLLVRPVLRALRAAWDRLEKSHEQPGLAAARTMPAQTAQYRGPTRGDRKSTRLNSSH